MTIMDFVKAFGVAVLLVALNVVIAFGVMWVYGNFINPGHEPAFYQQEAQRIAPWSSLVAGVFLFFLAGWEFAQRKPARNALMFAATFAIVYIILDVGIIAAAGALSALGMIVAASMASKLIAALAGAAMARRRAA